MKKRLVGLDLLRSLLIIEGVFFHASLVISPGNWTYSSQHYNSSLVSYFFSFFHYFRMDSFFFLAGFFSIMVITSKGVDYYIRDRGYRLVIPLVSLVFLVCLPQLYMLYLIRGDEYAFSIGDVLSHLWFLLSLVLIVFTHAVIIKNKLTIKFNFSVFYIAIITLFCTYLGYVTDYLMKFDLSSYESIKYIASLIRKTLTSSCFYMIGVYSYKNKEYILKHIGDNIKLYAILAVMCSSALIYINILLDSGSWNNISNFIKYPFRLFFIPILYFANSLFITFLLFKIFYNININSKLIDLIIKSALVIYVLHHPFVILFSYLFDGIGLGIFEYFIIVSALSVIFPLVIYQIFLKNDLFKLIFGIKTNNKLMKVDMVKVK